MSEILLTSKHLAQVSRLSIKIAEQTLHFLPDK
jgi:hypothetical protein